MGELSAISALLMGLAGGVHCVAMCGGVVALTQAATPVRLRRKPLRQLPLTLAHHAGRLGSYSVAGAIAGGASATMSRLVPVHDAQVALRIVAALLLVAVGLSLAGVWHATRGLERTGARFFRLLSPLARRLLPASTPWRAAALGSLWGFMPCGLVYSALAVALVSGSAARGALTMAAFGVGTLPTLLAMSTLASVLSRLVARPRVRGAAGLALGVMGVVSLLLAIMQLGAPAAHCH